MKFRLKKPNIKLPENRWKKWGVILGVGFFLFLIFSVSAVEFTSRSDFCKSCHYMKPFYESWKNSAHSDVKCVDCHYPPGLEHKLRGKIEGLVQLVNYFSQAYRKSKPWAEIPDESCLRSGCHDTQLLNGEEEFRGVHFSHAPHLTELRRGKKLRCTSCHSQIVQGEHILVTETSCFTCHFKQNTDNSEAISDCRLCHTDKRMMASSDEGNIQYDHTFAVENQMDCRQCHSQTVMGDGAVPRELCYNCHWENERLARHGETEFMHEMHITDHKVECNQCHLPIQHAVVQQDLASLAECTTCHTGAHNDEINLFAGMGGVGVEDVHNSMSESGMNCKGCHIYHKLGPKARAQGSDTYISRAKACEKCHGKGFAGLMQQWERTSEKKIKRLEALYQSANAELGRLGKQRTARESMQAARMNIDLVRKGKSVHNMSYADALLNVAHTKIGEGLKKAGSSMTLPSFADASTIIPSECATCHVSLQVEDVEVFGVDFSHESHVIDHDVNCQKCHSNRRTHGQLILNRGECLDCHHDQKKEKKCEECHDVTAALYTGDLSVLDEPVPDVMFEAELDCFSCHAVEGGQIAQSTKAHCLNCHDEGYDEMMVEWQTETQTRLNAVTEKRKTIITENLDESQVAALNRVDQIITIIHQDGSLGVHNYMLVDQLLSEVQEALSQF